MAARVLDNGGPQIAFRAEADDGGSANGGAAPGRRDSELRRMAAFRLHETANRIATLANSSADQSLQRALLAICQTLLREERALLDGIADR
jgi:hypothetical protein